MHNPIYIATSRWAAMVISAFYLAIIIALLLVPYWLPLRLLLIVCLLLDYYRVLMLYAFGKSRYSVVCLQPDCGKWLFQLRNGRCFKAELCKDGSFRSAIVLVLKMRHFSGARNIVIPRDALSVHNYRFLAFQINCL